MSSAVSTPPGPARSRAILGAILLAALLIRWIPALAGLEVPSNPDAVDYTEFARSLVEGKGYGYRPGNRDTFQASFRDRPPYGERTWVPTALRPPGYPVFLALLFTVSSSSTFVFLVQGLLGAASAAFFYRAVRLFASERAALLAAGITAFYPFLIYFCLQEISEGLFIALLAALAWALASWFGVPRLRTLALAGALQGGLILVRPQGAYYVPAVVLLLLVHAAGGGLAGRIRSAALYSGIALALQAPWAIRNQATLGEPVLFSTLGGFTFWLGNAYYAEHGTHQTFKWTDLGGTAPEIAGLSEPEMDRFYYRKSWAYVREHPGAVLGTYARKLWDLWRPAPHREFYAGSVYWVGLLSSLALYALAAAGTARLGFARPDVRLLLAMILSYSLLAAVHLTFVRHRAAAIDPLLVPLAAAGLDLLCPGRIFLNGRKDPAYDAAPVPRSPE